MEDDLKGVVTSVWVTQAMRDAVKASAVNAFGGKGLRIWVERAVEAFVEEPGWIGRVGYGEEHEAREKAKKVKLVLRPTQRTQEVLLKALGEVRSINPSLEGVRSQLLRSAMRRAIERKLDFQLVQREMPVSLPEPAIQISPSVPRIKRRGGSTGSR